MAEVLSEQIILDQKFRQAKWVFEEWTRADKWELLFKQYEIQFKGANREEAKLIFSISSEEHNPFF